MSEVFYGTAVLIGYLANWSTPPNIRFIHESNIDEDEDGRESRDANWHHMRQEVSWLVTVMDAVERGRVNETLRIAHVEKICAVPSWLEMRCISGAHGLQGVLHEETDFEWQAGKHLWYGRPDGSYGIVRVKSMASKSIEIFDDGVPLTDDMYLAPIVVGRIEGNPAITDHNAAIRDYKITVRERGGDENGLIRKVSEYLYTHISTTAECGIRHLDAEMVNLSIPVDGVLDTLAVVRDDPNSSTIGIDISASLDTIVFPRSAYEAATVGIDIYATLETVES